MMSRLRIVFLYGAAAVVAFVCGVLFGAVGIPFSEFVQDGALNPIVELRLVRTASAAVAGASLAVSGLVFQAVLRNALAEPFLLGVSGGAGLGAAGAILLMLPTSYCVISEILSRASLPRKNTTPFSVNVTGPL